MDQPNIFLSAPDIGAAEFAAFERVFESGWFAPAGAELDNFEKEVSSVCQREFAVALASGTSALHLGLIACGVGRGDFVICSTLTFVATANAIAYLGATPIFVDSSFDSGNMSPEILAECLEGCAQRGIVPSAIIVVDFLGKVADYDTLIPIAERWKVPIISDAAESLGSFLGGRPAGNFGQSSIFSFNGNKIVTTSGGGMLVTDDQDMADRVRFLSTQAKASSRLYHHEEVGYNYRLSNVLAAIGRAQLARLTHFVEQRRNHRRAYQGFFSRVDGVEVFGGDGAGDNCWLTAILIDKSMAWRPRNLIDFLASRGIESRHLWKPMHSQPLYEENLAFLDGSADLIFDQGVALPSGSKMSQAERDRVLSELESFLSVYR